jgi:hypothetical protein
MTMIRSLTSVTPGADHAAASASSCSGQEVTVPARITVPLGQRSTDKSSTASLALRLKAALIWCWM